MAVLKIYKRKKRIFTKFQVINLENVLWVSVIDLTIKSINSIPSINTIQNQWYTIKLAAMFKITEVLSELMRCFHLVAILIIFLSFLEWSCSIYHWFWSLVVFYKSNHKVRILRTILFCANIVRISTQQEFCFTTKYKNGYIFFHSRSERLCSPWHVHTRCTFWSCKIR